MAWAPLAFMAVSTLMSASAQKKSADASADQNEQNASDVLVVSAENERRKRVQAAAVQGKARVAGAANGATGSDIADILSSNAEQDEMEALQIRYSGQRQSRNYRNQASQDRDAGNSALVGGFLKAGSQLYGAGGFGGV